MSMGGVLFVAMVIAALVEFSIVLAYAERVSNPAARTPAAAPKEPEAVASPLFGVKKEA